MARILIIDDDLLVSKLLCEHLSNEGYDITTASMAEDGFQQALQNPPDLIFLDVNLPDATGFQMCGRFRMHAETQAIPIIMMTGAARWPNQQAIGKRMGANEYILKPFNVIDVGDRVHNLMGSKRPLPAEPPMEMEKAEVPLMPPVAEPEITAVVQPEIQILHEEPIISQSNPVIEESEDTAPSGNERYFEFSVDILILVTRLPKTRAGRHLADQLLQCGTAVGATIQELQSAESEQEIQDIKSRAVKKLRETAYWLMLIRRADILEAASLENLESQCEKLATHLTVKNQPVS